MTIKQRMDRLEKRNKRLTVALTMTVVAMCAVVTMAATDRKISDFDVVTARNIMVTNDEGKPIVYLGSNDDGGGVVTTRSAKGKKLVKLNATESDYGMVTTYQPNGKELVALSGTDNGGMVAVLNKTGKIVVGMSPDEYGNGAVVVSNLKGEVRTFHPGR